MKFHFVFFFLINFYGFAQLDSLQLIEKKNFPVFPFLQIELDEENNFYTLTPTHFLKLNQHFDTLFYFSYSEYQQINSFQTQGLTPFLFCQKEQKSIILTRFLTKKTEIIITPNLIEFVELACVSNDQHLWLLDNYQLKKYNYQSKRLIFQNYLMEIIVENDENTIFHHLTFYNNLLFLHTNTGFYIFDNLGNFNYFLPAKTNTFSLFENHLYFIENEKLISYHLFLHEKKIVNYSAKNIQHCQINKEKIYLFDDKKQVWIYKKN